MVRPAQPAQRHTAAGIPRSFEVFYAATVRRTLTTTLKKIDEPTIARRATQNAYAVLLTQWPDQQSRAADLGHRQGRSTAFPTIDRAEQRDRTKFEPHWFDIRTDSTNW